jgi:16S rRNA (cytidine1402-2'-O)-methyltransferase
MGHSPAERARCRLVGTPIGNLSDITPRAVTALREADIIFAEDTRTAKALLHHLNISKPLESYHKDNEQSAVASVLAKLDSGQNIALVSEAGMPGISDPGFLLVRTLIEKNLPFEIVPGVSAAVHAAVASGLCEHGQYLFAGFLPHKGSEKVLEKFKKIPFPIVFYESPHRVKETVGLLLQHFPAPVAVCRELTKLHEEVVWVHSTDEFAKITVKGEFCLVVDNSKVTADTAAGSTDYKKVAEILSDSGTPVKAIVEVLKTMGMKRNEAYEMAVGLSTPT